MIIEYTMAYSPQQNGTAERMNRTLVENARCLIYESVLHKEMRGEAIMTSVFLTNRIITNALSEDITPAEKWYGSKPDVSGFRVFGCLAYAHIPKCKRTKMDPKSKQYVMVGYGNNGFRLWDPHERKIVLSGDVVFDEEKFLKLINNEDQHSYEFVELSDKRETESNRGAAEEDNGESNSDGEQFLTDEGETDEQGAFESDTATKQARQSIRLRRPPVWHDDYVVEPTALLADGIEDVPQNYYDIGARDDAESWYEAIKEELASLEENNT